MAALPELAHGGGTPARQPHMPGMPVAGPQRPPVEVVVWGAHGGAGTSTLAALLGYGWGLTGWDLGSMGPDPARLRCAGRPLVLVCGCTAWAAQRATLAVSVAASCGEQVAVLAVVADGWPRPRAVNARLRLLRPRVGAIVTVPFLPTLRLADDPRRVPLPPRTRRALARIRAAATDVPSHQIGALSC